VGPKTDPLGEAEKEKRWRRGSGEVKEMARDMAEMV